MLEGGEVWWWEYSKLSYNDSAFLVRWKARILAEIENPGEGTEKISRQGRGHEGVV